MKMPGIVDLGGHTHEILAGQVEVQGAALLGPACAEVFHDFGGGLGQTPGEGVQKRRQHLGPRHDSAGRLTEGDCQGLQLPGKIPGPLCEVESETEDGERQTGRAGDGLDKEPSQFPIFVQEIIGPFQAGFEPGQGADGIRCGQGAEDGK